MKKQFIYLCLLLLYLLKSPIFSQTPYWTVYDTSNSGLPSNLILGVAVDEINNKWIITSEGLVKYDGINWTICHTDSTLNSFYKNYPITDMVIDMNGDIWAGLFNHPNGLAKYDGTNWTIYNCPSSYYPYSPVYDIAIDENNNKWVGGIVLAMFDGINWTVYDTSNSPLQNDVLSIAIDDSNNKWIGSWGYDDLVKFDGTNWTIYNHSGLPSNHFMCITIDDSYNKWIGTYKGLVMFDGTNWTIFDSLNSALSGYNSHCYNIEIDLSGNKWIGIGKDNFPDPQIWGELAILNGNNWIASNHGLPVLPSLYKLAIDKNDYAWIATASGLIVFDPVILGQDRKNDVIAVNSYRLSQNYPNPFNPSTSIEFDLPKTSEVTLKIFNILGEEVAILVSERLSAGSYTYEWDASNLASGVFIYRLQAVDFVETRKMVLMR